MTTIPFNGTPINTIPFNLLPFTGTPFGWNQGLYNTTPFGGVRGGVYNNVPGFSLPGYNVPGFNAQGFNGIQNSIYGGFNAPVSSPFSTAPISSLPVNGLNGFGYGSNFNLPFNQFPIQQFLGGQFPYGQNLWNTGNVGQFGSLPFFNGLGNVNAPFFNSPYLNTPYFNNSLIGMPGYSNSIPFGVSPFINGFVPGNATGQTQGVGETVENGTPVSNTLGYVVPINGVPFGFINTQGVQGLNINGVNANQTHAA